MNELPYQECTLFHKNWDVRNFHPREMERKVREGENGNNGMNLEPAVAGYELALVI